MSEAAETFGGTLVLVVPHMDDCVLGCGALLAGLPDKTRVHVVYATDGRGSPLPPRGWRGPASADLCPLRMAEARAAMAVLGIATERVYFLNLPDGRLRRHEPALRDGLADLFARIDPHQVLIPFRYDRHADHIAVNHAVMALQAQGTLKAQLYEYFVYYRWRLLPEGDVRRRIRPGHLLQVPVADAAQKRAALLCFTSQTTRCFAWQTRPNLTPELLDEVTQAPEMFVRYDPAFAGARIFTHATAWLRLAHRLEPLIKLYKDRAVAAWQRRSLNHETRTA
jgi:LmbE family N-acetylglucosaminyl deacetylase